MDRRFVSRDCKERPRGLMAQEDPTAPDFGPALAESYAVNDRMNQLVIEHLDPRAWRAKPPGRGTRNIAAIFSHVHNVRLKWVRLSAPHLKLPAKLDRARCTQEEAGAALVESAGRCCEMLTEALVGPDRRVKTFLRDGWAKPWTAGASMLAYMLAHDAHHRGQVCMLAHQLGFPLPGESGYGLWNWEKLWKDCGSVRRLSVSSRSRG
jgi:uncharacterized damage-inducible protein DinB